MVPDHTSVSAFFVYEMQIMTTMLIYLEHSLSLNGIHMVCSVHISFLMKSINTCAFFLYLVIKPKRHMKLVYSATRHIFINVHVLMLFLFNIQNADTGGILCNISRNQVW